MIIEEIKPNGFCGGVKNAIKMITQNIDSFEKPVYMLGHLIHNTFIVNSLINKGITLCLEDPINALDKIDKGTVIITAHGASKDVYEKALLKGLNIVDTTCYNVRKIHEMVEKKISKDYKVYIIGNKNHPEIKGILGINPNIEIYNNQPLHDKSFICNQTTLNFSDLTDTFNEIKSKYPNVEINNEVCSATRQRQEAVKLNAKKYDLIIVVGDKLSNNCNSLYMTALKENVNAIKVSSLDDINDYDLTGYNRVGITSGASTPKELLNEIMTELKNYNKNTIYKSKLNVNNLL